MLTNVAEFLISGFVTALMVGVVVWFTAFLYRFRLGRSLFTDALELMAPVWARFPLIPPLLLAAATAYAAVNDLLLLAFVSAAVFVVALIYLGVWLHRQASKTGSQ